MKKDFYIKLSKNQRDKIGNSIIYFLEKIDELSKTKILKLIYILDELSIKKSGIPFFNLKYKVWKFGPVSEEIFIDLSSEITFFKEYITKTLKNGVFVFQPLAKFNDDEFSDNDIELLNFVIENFGTKSAKDLVRFTHRKKSPWYSTAVENSVLELLEKEEINNTELLVNMKVLVQHDSRKKLIYNNFIAEN